MKVGFAGSRKPLTEEQTNTLARWFDRNAVEALHHAGHIGAEGGVHGIASQRKISVELHPPLNHLYRSVQGRGVDVYHNARPLPHLYFDIVHSTDCLLIAPELNKGQTKADWLWEITRYALRAHKPVHIFWPSGEVDTVHSLTEFRGLSTKKKG